ncbi:uncharacterized protein [Onthophagus taurus]|uniref:uncharacterized protein n=1 Tax=Onthophagus taurus TaxID=166361 RepID=UPI000C2072CF|nr:uncharacterized protein LOC111429179 [Onthophagus taurus]
MRKNMCELATSEPTLKLDSNRYSDNPHAEGGSPQPEPESCESFLRPSPDVTPSVVTEDVVQKRLFGHAFIQSLRVIFTCWYRVLEFVFEVVTNKWVWNVLLITLYVLFDVFFHLVLAASAIMVTIIINMDNVYRKGDDDDEDEGDSNTTSFTDVNGMYENETKSCKKKK